MFQGNKELAAELTRLYQALLIIMHIQVVCSTVVHHLRVAEGINF